MSKSWKLDTIEEEEEEATTDDDDGGEKAKDKADAKARDFMAASDDEEAEEEISMVEQVARGDFAEDGDEMDSDGIFVQEESPKPVATDIALKAHARSIFAESIIAEYDDYAEDAIYEDDETAAVRSILYR